MMTLQHFILATAGHVDHGKSALVKALTGTDPDRLPEEKARGITIDLGFAHLDLHPAAPQAAGYRLGIVDVPGHEDFVKNMVAGVGSIDLALLVVAADDGWMPQTEEHLQILSYLGVARGVVALTKADLVEGKEAAVMAALRARLEGSAFQEAPMVATSVVTGRGLAELEAALIEVLATAPKPRDCGKPRLPIDRVFTLHGVGTVVTGTLSGGRLARGQNVVIQPAVRESRIRSLQSYNAEVQTCVPGARTALNLPDLAARGAGDPTGIGRGDVVTRPGLGSPSDTVEVVLEKSARLAGSESRAAKPLKDGARVWVHHGSGSTPAKVLLHEGGALLPGQRLLAQLRLEAPIFVFLGDRFIVRDWAELATLGGGLVLEPDAGRVGWRSEGRQRCLAARAAAPDNVAVCVLSQLARDGFARQSELLKKSRFSDEEVAGVCQQLAAGQRLVAVQEWWADAARWRGLLDQAAAAIHADHGAHPERPGLPLSDLRALLQAQLPEPGLFEGLVSRLCQEGFGQSAAALGHASHRPALPAQLQAAGARLRGLLGAKPLEPPSRKELAPDGPSQQALRFLLQTGEAVEISADVVLSAEAWQRAKSLIVHHLRQHGSATVSGLRQVVGSSRRIMVPLLERLDREGITRREGDLRFLGRNA